MRFQLNNRRSGNYIPQGLKPEARFCGLCGTRPRGYPESCPDTSCRPEKLAFDGTQGHSANGVSRLEFRTSLPGLWLILFGYPRVPLRSPWAISRVPSGNFVKQRSDVDPANFQGGKVLQGVAM